MNIPPERSQHIRAQEERSVEAVKEGKKIDTPDAEPRYLTPECGPHCGYQGNIGSVGGHEGHHVCPLCHPTEKSATKAYRANRT